MTCMHEHHLSKQYAEYLGKNNDQLLQSKESITKVSMKIKLTISFI